ncbi:MAG: sigma factor [Balneolales bacterium]
MSQRDKNARFYEALKNKNNKVLNEEFNKIRQGLIDYLIYTRGADKASAEDAVSVAFLKALEAIENNKIEKKESLYSWLLHTSRSIYRDEKNKLLNKITDKNEFQEDYYLEPGEQISLLNDPDRERYLRQCMDKLSADMRVTIDYFLEYPDTPLDRASKALKISYITLRRRKSRITHQLHDCVRKLMRKD